MKRFLPLLAFLAVALVGTIAATFVWLADDRAERLAFEAVTAEAANRIEARLGRHMLLIETTAAFFEAQNDRIDASDFRTFVEYLRLGKQRTGIAGLGYAAFASRVQRPALATAYREINGSPLLIWPESDQRYCACVLFFEGDGAITRKSGFDAYGEEVRRQAIDRAIAESAPRATVPVSLEGDTRRDPVGFLVYAPVYSDNFGIAEHEGTPKLPTGFVFGGFRFEELVEAVLGSPPIPPVHLTVFNTSDPSRALSSTGKAPVTRRFGPDLNVEHRIQFAGQEWILAFSPTAAFRPSQVRLLTLVLGLSSLLLAAAAAALIREQGRARQSAELLAATTQQSLGQKEMMLQEMKHRIKNAISRILAIARQTAAHADNVEAFTETFTERLQAMSNAQDILTRSGWQRADLHELVRRELWQVFGTVCDATPIEGPPIEIDEKTTHALGLTFHELATNALKYGGCGDTPPAISVTWEHVRHAAQDAVRIDWRESGGDGIASPTATGFGTRLIEANVRHELGGTVERSYLPGGLHMRLTVPLTVPS